MAKYRIFCNSCENITWHEVVASHKQEREDNLWGYPQIIDSEIVRCCGCYQLAFRLIKHPFEFQDKNDKPEEEIYPERGFKKRKRRFYIALPREVYNFYHETLAAHDIGLALLSAVGLRALIEAIVKNKFEEGEYGANLESKINALSKHFSETTIDTLHEFRIMGNEAIHSQIAPDRLDIHRALFVVEGIMEFFYGIDEHVDMYHTFKDGEKAKNKAKKTNRKQT